MAEITDSERREGEGQPRGAGWPSVLIEDFEQLQQAVQAVRAIATTAEPDAAALQRAFQSLQAHFQEALRRAAALEAEVPPQLPPIQTEMNRLLRLLSVDLMGLRAARTPATRDQRLQQMGDRLSQLSEFCAGALALAQEPPP